MSTNHRSTNVSKEAKIKKNPSHFPSREARKSGNRQDKADKDRRSKIKKHFFHYLFDVYFV